MWADTRSIVGSWQCENSVKIMNRRGCFCRKRFRSVLRPPLTTHGAGHISAGRSTAKAGSGCAFAIEPRVTESQPICGRSAFGTYGPDALR